MLASIDLRSQHGRLVSARFNASVRKGVQGSCNRAASQAAGRAYRIVLQRSRPRRGEERWFERPSGQKFSIKVHCLRFPSGPFYIVRLSRSGFVCLRGFKRKILAFVEIAVCAGELLLTPFARNRTGETRMLLRQITHPSPYTAIAPKNRGPTGGFKPT